MEDEWLMAGLTDLRNNLERLENAQTTLDQFWSLYSEEEDSL